MKFQAIINAWWEVALDLDLSLNTLNNKCAKSWEVIQQFTIKTNVAITTTLDLKWILRSSTKYWMKRIEM